MIHEYEFKTLWLFKAEKMNFMKIFEKRIKSLYLKSIHHLILLSGTDILQNYEKSLQKLK